MKAHEVSDVMTGSEKVKLLYRDGTAGPRQAHPLAACPVLYRQKREAHSNRRAIETAQGEMVELKTLSAAATERLSPDMMHRKKL